MSYRIHGITSDGDDFTVGPYFEDHDEAVTYAMEYARGVSGTTEVQIERYANRTEVIAMGQAYAEKLTIDL